MSRAEVLQGGCDVERPPSSERTTTSRRNDDWGFVVAVSEWMVKGNVNEFVKVNTKAERLEFVRFFVHNPYLRSLLMITRLLWLGDVARGLIYMHEEGVVHGNLKGVRFQAPLSPPST